MALGMDSDMGQQVRQRQVPVIGGGRGVSSFVHVEDAAAATATGLHCASGVYDVVDGSAVLQHKGAA